MAVIDEAWLCWVNCHVILSISVPFCFFAFINSSITFYINNNNTIIMWKWSPPSNLNSKQTISDNNGSTSALK